MTKPVVAIPSDTNWQGPHLYHQAGDKYIAAMRRQCDVTPVIIPSLTDNQITVEEILSFADGVLFTGAYSNIQRRHYGAPDAPDGEHEDPGRDLNTLPALPRLIDAGMPLLAICRGMQEMNVAFGGTLYPRLHEIDGRFDHREDDAASLDVQYAHAHSVTVRQGGLLHTITGEEEFMVNSVHGQGVRDLAPGLTVEAVADDDTVEAVTAEGAKGFNLAVQWHPEWKADSNPQSVKVFSAFGDAVRAYRQARKPEP